MKTKFDFRRLFPICYYRFKNGYEFNAIAMNLDLLIYGVALILLIRISHYIINL
jgi:hypothetical protein